MRIPLSLLYAHQTPLASSHTNTNRAFRTNFAFFLGSKPKPSKLWYILYNANNLRFLQDIHCIRVNYVSVSLKDEQYIMQPQNKLIVLEQQNIIPNEQLPEIKW